MRVENGVLSCLTLSIEAALAEPPAKIRPIKELRIALAVSKRLIRLCQELEILEEMISLLKSACTSGILTAERSTVRPKNSW